MQKYDRSRGASFLTFKEFYIHTALHSYIRTMRTGYTIQSRDEDAKPRKAKAISAEHDYRDDDETIGIIAREINRKPEIVRELLQGGLRNMDCVDVSRQYCDDGSEEDAKDVLVTSSADPYHMLLNEELEEALLTVIENLDYREQAIVSEHLDFCPECFSDYQLVTYESDRKIRQRIKPKAIIDIAYDHGLASPSSANCIYRKALEKAEEGHSGKNSIKNGTALTLGEVGTVLFDVINFSFIDATISGAVAAGSAARR